jgi:hypothetical protein
MTGEPVPVRDHDGIAVILMVSGMIAYRGRLIAGLLKKFEETSDRMHRDQTPHSAGRRADELVSLANRIHGLAQDNGYDVRKLLVYLGRREEDMLREGADTGQFGQVCYIQ